MLLTCWFDSFESYSGAAGASGGVSGKLAHDLQHNFLKLSMLQYCAMALELQKIGSFFTQPPKHMSKLPYKNIFWMFIYPMKPLGEQKRNKLKPLKPVLYGQIKFANFKFIIVVLIYPSVTGQGQTLTIGRSAHFSVQRILRVWWNPHLP